MQDDKLQELKALASEEGFAKQVTIHPHTLRKLIERLERAEWERDELAKWQEAVIEIRQRNDGDCTGTYMDLSAFLKKAKEPTND